MSVKNSYKIKPPTDANTDLLNHHDANLLGGDFDSLDISLVGVHIVDSEWFKFACVWLPCYRFL